MMVVKIPFKVRRRRLIVDVARKSPRFAFVSRQHKELAFLTAAYLYEHDYTFDEMSDEQFDALGAWLYDNYKSLSPQFRRCVAKKNLKKASYLSVWWDVGVAAVVAKCWSTPGPWKG